MQNLDQRGVGDFILDVKNDSMSVSMFKNADQVCLGNYIIKKVSRILANTLSTVSKKEDEQPEPMFTVIPRSQFESELATGNNDPESDNVEDDLFDECKGAHMLSYVHRDKELTLDEKMFYIIPSKVTDNNKIYYGVSLVIAKRKEDGEFEYIRTKTIHTIQDLVVDVVNVIDFMVFTLSSGISYADFIATFESGCGCGCGSDGCSTKNRNSPTIDTLS